MVKGRSPCRQFCDFSCRASRSISRSRWIELTLNPELPDVLFKSRRTAGSYGGAIVGALETQAGQPKSDSVERSSGGLADFKKSRGLPRKGLSGGLHVLLLRPSPRW